MTDSERYSAIRSNALYFDGANAKSANGGSRIQLYAPAVYKSGSSVSHWDDSVTFLTFMKYRYGGRACHRFGARKLGLMKDLGWTLAPAAPVAPATPTGLNASDGSLTESVSLSWTASPGATGYKLYRGTSNNSSAATLLGGPSGTNYTDISARPGVLYYYWVKASNAAGDSAYSAYDTGFRKLAAPANVSASNNDSAAVTVSWSAVTGATHYRVWRATSASGSKTALGSWQSALSYADTTANVGTTYYYWVSAAVDSSGTRPSSYSAFDTAYGLTPHPPRRRMCPRQTTRTQR